MSRIVSCLPHSKPRVGYFIGKTSWYRCDCDRASSPYSLQGARFGYAARRAGADVQCDIGADRRSFARELGDAAAIAGTFARRSFRSPGVRSSLGGRHPYPPGRNQQEQQRDENDNRIVRLPTGATSIDQLDSGPTRLAANIHRLRSLTAWPATMRLNLKAVWN